MRHLYYFLCYPFLTSFETTTFSHFSELIVKKKIIYSPRRHACVLAFHVLVFAKEDFAQKFGTVLSVYSCLK